MKLYDIFQKELKRQNDGMNTNQNKVVEQEEDLETFIKYDTSYFTEAFNRILFNLMMRQAKRNE